jgi:hypothetical protein
MLKPRQIVLGLMLSLALCGECWAKSQRPPPTEWKAGQPEQQQPNAPAPQQPPATDQRGTDQSPFIVKTLPTQSAQEDAEQAKKEREARASNDQEVIKFNSRLVIIGCLQLVVFALQLIVFGYQAWKLRQTVAATEKAVDAAKGALIATARPRIIVRKVEAIFQMPPNRSVSAQFAITNVGGSRTVLIERNAILDTSYRQRGNPFPKYVGSAVSNEYWLESGEPLYATANFANPHTDPTEENIRSGASPLFLFGFVKYRDEAGVVREMGFGRQFDPKANRFRPLNDQEVEYGD